MGFCGGGRFSAEKPKGEIAGKTGFAKQGNYPGYGAGRTAAEKPLYRGGFVVAILTGQFLLKLAAYLSGFYFRFLPLRIPATKVEYPYAEHIHDR